MTLAPNAVHVGDCRELMDSMEPGSVDVVFTSPPWNCGRPYPNWNDRMPGNDYHRFTEEWLAGACRVMREGARLYCVIPDQLLRQVWGQAESVGLAFAQLLLWCKPNISAGGGRQRNDWNPLTEICLLFRKGKRTPMLDCRSTNTHNWIVATAPQSRFGGQHRKVHCAQMALAVAVRWLSRTPGQVVLDPFVGSGTTLLAAKLLGRQYIGIEIDPGTAELARQRVDACNPMILDTAAEQASLEWLG